MTVLIGDRSLRLLSRRKLSGAVSKQLRRLNTKSGALFGLFGLGLFALWIGGVVIMLLLGELRQPAPERLLPMARLALAVLFLMSSAGHLAHRGLHLPAGEVDALLAAPVSRADLLRHRLHAVLGRSAFGALLFAALAAVRVPLPAWGGLAAALAVVFVTVSGQGIALALGAIEHRLPAGLLRWFSRSIFIGAAILVAIIAGLSTQDIELPGLQSVLEHPIAVAIGLPFHPWGALAAAESLAAGAPWALACLALTLGAFELVARLPFDFREQALDTSAELARRMRRLQQSGPGMSAQAARRGFLSGSIPWVFGRGPMGAVAWRKSASMLRRATGTLGMAAFVAIVVVLLGSGVLRAKGEMGVVYSIPTALMAVFYLCSGLRYDFREDIDRLDAIKSWPLAPTKLFTAMIAPEAVFVAVLVALMILAQAAIGNALHPLHLAVILGLPPLVLLWLAIDNALFLKWPVRLVPGQDGALQNLGRATVLMALRGLLMLVVLGVAAGCGLGVGLGLREAAGTGPAAASVAGIATALAGLSCAAWAALRVGGWALLRFDPADDRP